jgi:hypothetical protein
MDGAIREEIQVEEVTLLSYLDSFSSAGRIASLHLHTQMPTPLVGLSFLGGTGGQEPLAYLTIPSHFLHLEKACKKQVTCQRISSLHQVHQNYALCPLYTILSN